MNAVCQNDLIFAIHSKGNVKGSFSYLLIESVRSRPIKVSLFAPIKFRPNRCAAFGWVVCRLYRPLADPEGVAGVAGVATPPP